MKYLEIGATVFGLLQGYLAMINKRSNWIAYVIQMLLMLLFSLGVHLYGDALNSLFYVFVGVVGYIVWNKKGEKGITKCSLLEKVIYVLVISIGTFIIYLSLKNTNDPLPLIDAFTTASSFVATYYMLVKKIDTWIIWFINDIFYCITYYLIPGQALYLLALNVVWTFMAIGSYINWNKVIKESKK